MSARILIFDSGVGGLSVWQAIHSRMPELQPFYLMDNEAQPYGELADDYLVKRAVALISDAVAQCAPAMVVVACNSASTLVLPELRAKLEIPVVGVVPAIKPAALQSKNKHIGILATPGTVARAYTQALIDEFAADCQISRLGSSELVLMAEQKLAGQAPSLPLLRQLLSSWAGIEGPDTIVLGCTHFPLLASEIQQALPQVCCIDSGDAIARRVEALFQDASIDAGPTEVPSTLWFTKRSESLGAQWAAFSAAGLVESQEIKSRH
ncbi:glutamate racemase [Corallincola platygyrae]|uniref:Glutamate racemase n=1 Tax=Corallincola platygyrae TaxID=1193278 RepID=A0ABW4XMV6_9GAMM